MRDVLTPMARSSSAVALAALLGSCVDATRTGPVPMARAALAVGRGPDVAVLGSATLPPTAVTNVRIRLTPPGGTTPVRDTVVAFPADSGTLTVELLLQIAGTTQTFDALVQLRNGTDVLLETRGPVTARPVAESAPPAPLPAPAPPPGTPLPDAIAVAPLDTTVFQGDSLLLRVSGTRGGAPFGTFVYTQAPVDTGVRIGPASGFVRTPGRRGGTYVRVRVPGTALADSVFVRYQPRPSGVAVVSGNNQSGTVATGVAQPLVARVVGADGQGVRGIAVTFAAPAVAGAAVGAATATSDTAGLVQTTATLGQVAQGQAFTATVAGVPAATFTLTATPGAPATLAADTATTATTTVNTAVGLRPRVRVTDVFGNAVPGRDVVFRRANPARGSLTDSVPATDAQGRAQLGTWTAGTLAGEDTVLASVATPALGPVRFVAAVGPGAPAAVVKLGGDAQDGLPGTALSDSLVVRVQDAFANAVPGATVTFAASAGTLTRTTVTTDAQGRASAGAWTLPGTYGGQTATATVAGVTPVAFTATTAKGIPTFLTLSNVGAATDTIEAQRAGIVGTLKDGMSQGLSGRRLRLRPRSAQSGSIVGGDSTGTTDEAGQVSFAGAWQLASQPGADTLYLLADDAPTLRDSGLVTVGPGKPFMLTKVSGDNQAGTFGQATAIVPTVKLTDRRENPLAGAAVAFAASGGGTVTTASAPTDAAGVASPGAWTLGASGIQTLTASVPGLAAVTFTAATGPGEPASVALLGVGASADTVRATRGGLAALVKDAGGTVLPGVSVRILPRSARSGLVVGTDSAKTDSTGKATFLGYWQLDSLPGSDTLEVVVTGTPTVRASVAVGTTPGARYQVNASQYRMYVPEGDTARTVSFVARDRWGNGIPGVPLTILERTGTDSIGGTLSLVTSDASGVVTYGGAQAPPAGVTRYLEASVMPCGLYSRCTSFVAITGTGAPAFSYPTADFAPRAAGSVVDVTLSLMDANSYPAQRRTVTATMAVTEPGLLPGTTTTATRVRSYVSDDSGKLVIPFALGAAPGTNRLTLQAGTAPPLAIVVPTYQQGFPGTQLRVVQPPPTFADSGTTALAQRGTVLLVDAGGNPVPGIPVQFDTIVGSGNGPGTMIGTVTTGTDGVAQAPSRGLPARGMHQLRVSVPSIPSVPPVSMATYAIGRAASIVPIGTPVGFLPNCPSPGSLLVSVRVLDAQGLPRPGVTVTYAFTTNGGSWVLPGYGFATTTSAGNVDPGPAFGSSVPAGKSMQGTYSVVGISPLTASWGCPLVNL